MASGHALSENFHATDRELSVINESTGTMVGVEKRPDMDLSSTAPHRIVSQSRREPLCSGNPIPELVPNTDSQGPG